LYKIKKNQKKCPWRGQKHYLLCYVLLGTTIDFKRQPKTGEIGRRQKQILTRIFHRRI
jgi:hypothetical protein